LKILFEGKHEPHILLVHADEKPSKITLDGAELVKGVDWTFDVEKRRVIIRTGEYREGKYELLTKQANHNPALQSGRTKQ